MSMIIEIFNLSSRVSQNWNEKRNFPQSERRMWLTVIIILKKNSSYLESSLWKFDLIVLISQLVTPSGMANGIQNNIASGKFSKYYIQPHPFKDIYLHQMSANNFILLLVTMNSVIRISNRSFRRLLKLKQTNQKSIRSCICVSSSFFFLFFISQYPSYVLDIHCTVHWSVHWILHIIYRMYKRKQHQHNQRWNLNKPKSMLDMETSKFANFSDRKQIAWSILQWTFRKLNAHKS